MTNQENCLIIKKIDIDIISKSLEEYWGLDIHDKKSLININNTRQRMNKLKDHMKNLSEIKVCWS